MKTGVVRTTNMKNPLLDLVKVAEEDKGDCLEVRGMLSVGARQLVTTHPTAISWATELARRRVIEDIASVLYGPVMRELDELAHKMWTVEPVDCARQFQIAVNCLWAELLRPKGLAAPQLGGPVLDGAVVKNRQEGVEPLCDVTVTPPVTPAAWSK